MDSHTLQQLVEDISLEFFNRPFKHEARFNQRLKTTGGRYLLKSHAIEINPKQYGAYGKEALIGIIKHELCHYHLHLLNRGYRHRDQDFKALLNQVGGARYCQSIPGLRREESLKYTYRCKGCGRLYPRKRKVDTRRLICRHCHGRLNLI